MKARLKERIKTLFAPGAKLAALLLAMCAASGAWAETNPVTGEPETYDNTFNGTTEESEEWNAAGNWSGSVVPYVSGGNYNPALVANKTVSTSTAIDGYNLRVGAYNGAHVIWSGGIAKIQAVGVTAWLTADETSSITITSFAGNQLEGSDSAPLKLSSAKAGGITWSTGLTAASNTSLPFWYYLKGNGTVVYNGDITVANAQVIKQADITLSGTSQLAHKTLVTFGTDTTVSFTADAIIKRLDSTGNDLDQNVAIATVRSGSHNLNISTDAVGTCELVQTSAGIELWWVDGNPSDIGTKTYKPSISINFTSGTALSTEADVGIDDYAIPGISWNNLIGNNGSLATLKGADKIGAASTISGAKVTISGTRGYWTRDGLSATTDLRQAYIDDNDGNATPTIVVEGIPYYSYKVVLYFSNDTDGRQFGHLTINGTNYKWDSTNNQIVTCAGTSSDVWGSSSGTAYTEGGNYLVFPAMVNTDGTLTIVGHRWSGTQRMGVAAIQIVEDKPATGDNDLIIEVSGNTTHTVTSEEQSKVNGTGMVYLTGNGTLTLDGSAKISAATIDVGPLVTLNVNADRLDAPTFTGGGTVVYNGVVPPTGKGWTESTWTGTVWIKNKSGITGNNNATTGVQPNSLGNTGSKVKFSGVSGWVDAPVTYDPEIILEDDSYDYALQLVNGNSPNKQSDANNNRATTIKKLSGSGTLCCGGTSTAVPTLKVYDASGFTGSINTANASGDGYTGLVVVYCDESTTLPSSLVDMFIDTNLKRTIYVASGKEMTLASGATWTAVKGFVVEGTLIANGTLASTHETKAVSGSGTVVFNGKMPSPTGDAWWKNSDWDGTVQIKSAAFTGVSGVATYLDVNKYGNTDSVLELNNCSGWLPVGNTTGDNICTVPLKVTGTLTINDGYSNTKFTINKLSGNGTIYSTSNGATVTIQILEADDFTGYVQLNSKRVIFGETIPSTFTGGQIYVGSGFSFTVPNSDVAWYGTGGITVDGELKATALSNFGGGTTITTTDNGVLTLTCTDNVQDWNTDYSRIAGTGTLKLYSASKWRMLSRNNFPITVTLENELSDGLLLAEVRTYASGNLYEIGNLAGTKKIRSDYNSGDRDFRVNQFRDTEWSGVFGDGDRIGTMYVRGGASGTGTLTLSGVQTHENSLNVEATGSVNLTGTWKGATTVSGTFGGSGRLTGALTLSSGSTFKPDGIEVSGGVSMASGSTLDLTAHSGSDVAISGDLTITSDTTIAFPAGVSFPYKLATSISGVSALSASQCTVGGAPWGYPLKISGGDVYFSADASIDSSSEVSWNNLNWDSAGETGDGLTINVTESCTLNLGSASATKVTFNVDSGKTLTLKGTIIALDICISGEGKVLCTAANTLNGMVNGVVTGSGTVEYPNHTIPNISFTDDDWTGTLILPNCGRLNNEKWSSTAQQRDFRFERYGSQYSKIKVPGFKGDAATTSASTKVCAAELVIDGGTTVVFNHGDESIISGETDVGFIFSKLSGSGTLRLDGRSDTVQYVFRNVSGFAGSVEITDPTPDDFTGGKKSFIFGVDDQWTIANRTYPAYLVVATSMTVAGGKQWEVPAGIMLLDGVTLTLADGATLSRIRTQTDLGATLAVQANATATVDVADDGNMPAKINIASEATLKFSNTTIKKLTIPADVGVTYTNSGTLDLRKCSALRELHLDLGSSNGNSINLSKITLPDTCNTICYDIGETRNLSDYILPSVDAGMSFYYYATETLTEYAADGRDESEPKYFIIANVPAGASVKLLRRSGAEVNAEPQTSGSSTYIYKGGSQFAGNACWHEWDFESQSLVDTGMYIDDANNKIALQTDSPLYKQVTVNINPGSENKKAISSASKPYPTLSMTFSDTWSAAVRCSMPSTADQVAVAFGDTTSGIVGLASGADGFVDLFTWTSVDGGKYTSLAQMKVESPSNDDNMHIYVFAVQYDSTTSKRYLSFYRDGEFIHKAEITVSGITTFKVGDVSGRTGSESGLPAAATSGYTDYVRVYDKILDQSLAEALTARRPFASSKDTYEREVSVEGTWVESGEWTKKGGDGTTYDSPADNQYVTVSVTQPASIAVNLSADSNYDTLIFKGAGAISLLRGANTGKVKAGMVVVRSGTVLRAAYNSVDFANFPVGVDEGAVLQFDFSNYPFESVTTTTRFFVTGPVVAAEYDSSVASRISVVGGRSHTWTLSGDIVRDVVSGRLRYQVTIAPVRTVGTDAIYYQGGYLDIGITGDTDADTGVFSDSAFTQPTTLVAGDKVVIPSGAPANVWVSSTFNGNIEVTRSELNLKPGETAATLSGRTITVADGCTLHLMANNDGRQFTFGALTLNKNGSGAIIVDDDATAASISGNADITIDSDATLTLTSLGGTFTGRILGTGTVKLPTIEGSIDFNTYGNVNSTVVVTGLTAGVLTSGGTCNPTLLLSGNAAFTSVGTYTFAKITGSGNLSFPFGSTVTISDLADYTGSIANNSSTAVTVTKLTKTGAFVVGDVLLTKSAGTVKVSAVEIGGVEKHGYWDDNNFYVLAATYNDTNYKTVAEAITAAGDANLAGITVYETSETLNPQYRYVTEGDVTRVAKMPFAVVNGATTTYHIDAQSAIITVGQTPGLAYDYIEVLVGGNLDIPLNLLAELKIKNTEGATLNFTGVAEDCTTSYGDPVDGVVTYITSNKPTEYTWTGAAIDSSTGTSDARWEAKGNWSYVNSSGLTAAASRYPQDGDTVVFSSAASVTVGNGATVSAIQCAAAVTFSNSSETKTITAPDGIFLTASTATLTLTGVALSADPTTTVGTTLANSSVKQVGNVYSVVPYNTTSNGESGAAAVTTVNTDPATPAVEVSVELSAGYEGKLVVPSNVTKLAITGSGTVTDANIGLFVTYNNGASATTHYGILKLDVSGNVLLNPAASVNGVKVEPEVDATASSPIAFEVEAQPRFAVKAIPGLWYQVLAGTSPSSFGTAGTAVQANGTTVAPQAPEFPAEGNVYYYKIGVSAAQP